MTSELEKQIEAYHDRARRAETARQEKELAVEHERAVLAVRDDFGGRIHELEAENKALQARIQDLEAQLSEPANGEWRAEYPLLALVVGLIAKGEKREKIGEELRSHGYTRKDIALLLRPKLKRPSDSALNKFTDRLLENKS